MDPRGCGDWTCFECLIHMSAIVCQGHVSQLRPSSQRPHGVEVSEKHDGVTGIMSSIEGEGVSPSITPVVCAHHLPILASKEGIRRHRHWRGSALLGLGLCVWWAANSDLGCHQRWGSSIWHAAGEGLKWEAASISCHRFIHS